MKTRTILFVLATVLAMTTRSFAQATTQPETNLEATKPDPNFYVYLAFGQSNMAGGRMTNFRLGDDHASSSVNIPISRTVMCQESRQVGRYRFIVE